jgi:predicted permease
MWLDQFRYAWRRLGKSPGFALTVVLILTLGIGANTAIFSVVSGVLLKPLRYPNPQQLVTIREGITLRDTGFPDLPANANHLMYWRQHSRSFSGIAALLPASMPLGGGGQPEEIGIAQQTANLFNVLGSEPRIGRNFLPEEEQPGHNHVVILTDGLWRSRYGADPDIAGKTITLDGRMYEVVGVLPAGFALPHSRAIGGLKGTNRTIEAFVPFGWTADILQETEGDHNYFAIARLRPGVTVDQAAAELKVLQRAISEQTPDKVKLGAAVTPLQEYVTGASRTSLLLLLAAVAAVFLIACINIANLLLTRAITNERETAVRIALGSTRGQLFSGALAEPAILCALGWILGIALAATGIPLLVRSMPIEVPRLGEVHVDLTAIAFACGISVAAALFCSLLPVWRYLSTDTEPALRANARTASDSRRARRVRGVLVVAEAAASVALMVIAGLFVTSIVKLMHVSRGFDAQHVLSAEVVLPDEQYGDKAIRNSFYQRTLTRLRQLPGVTAAGAVSVLPLDGDYWGDLIGRIGDNTPLWQRPKGHFRWMTPGYLEALHVPVLAGRTFEDRDFGRRVALISRSVAAKVWPGESAIGQKFQRGDPDEPPFEVIGVVDDIRTLDLSMAPPRMVYVPYWYRSREAGTFVIRTRQDPASMSSTLRKAIWSIDPQVPVPLVRTMEDVVSGSISARRFELNLLVGFAASAMLLAALGIYGVVAYSAVQRTREIGIRMAIGATARDVYELIVAQGMAPVLIGSVIGIGIAALAGRLISSLLFQVSAYDPLVAIVAAAILILAGACACLVPAWRAANTEPVQALRFE